MNQLPNRRKFIRDTALAGGSLLAFSGSSFNIIDSSRQDDQIIGQGDFRYRIRKDWGDLDPAKRPVKNCHEMIMDSKGRLVMVGDETKNNILIYDRSGKLLDFWGISYVGGHGLTHWDAGGEEFLFICDTEGMLIKATLYGRELMRIGHPSTYGAYAEGDPFSPTESAIGPNGDIYLADGYGSNYVLQFTSEGEFIRKIGGGKGDGEDQFRTAHGVCIDDRNGEPSLLITSRAHNCFKRFTLEGKYLETIDLPGAYVCRPVIQGRTSMPGSAGLLNSLLIRKILRLIPITVIPGLVLSLFWTKTTRWSPIPEGQPLCTGRVCFN